jgi:hypothetical protein
LTKYKGNYVSFHAAEYLIQNADFLRHKSTIRICYEGHKDAYFRRKNIQRRGICDEQSENEIMKEK